MGQITVSQQQPFIGPPVRVKLIHVITGVIIKQKI